MGGYKEFARNDILEPEDVHDYLQLQAVMVFNTEIERNSALIGFLRPGVTTFIRDTLKLETWDGSTWNTYALYDALESPVLEDEIRIRYTMDTTFVEKGADGLPVLFYQIFQNYVDGNWGNQIWS